MFHFSSYNVVNNEADQKLACLFATYIRGLIREMFASLFPSLS